MRIFIVLLLGCFSWPGVADSQVKDELTGRYDYIRDVLYYGFRSVANNGKYGMVNRHGKEIVPCISDDYLFPQGRYLKVECGDKQGLYDTNGRRLLDCIYDRIMLPVDRGRIKSDYILVEIDGKKGMADSNGQIVVPIIYADVDEVDDCFLRARIGDSVGIIDPYNRLIIPVVYKSIEEARGFRRDKSSYFGVQDFKGHWGMMDSSGRQTIPFVYDGMLHYHDGPAVVQRNGKFGVLTNLGKEIIPLIYDDLDHTIYGFYEVKSGKKWGVADSSGRLLIPCRYGKVKVVSKNEVFLKKQDKWGCFDIQGKEIQPHIFDRFGDNFFTDAYEVVENGRYGLLDTNFKLIVPCRYKGARLQDNNTYAVKTNSGWGVVDAQGRVVVPCKYRRVEKMCEGFYIVSVSDSKWKVMSERKGEVGEFTFNVEGNPHDGFTAPFVIYDKAVANVQRRPLKYIDTNGTISRLPSQKDQYILAGNFSEGLAAVQDDQGYWGYIDKNGTVVIALKYDYAGEFKDELAVIAVDGKYGYINKQGTEVIKCAYQHAKPFAGSTATVLINYKWGLIDKAGRLVQDCIYKEPVLFSEGLTLQYREQGKDRDRFWYIADSSGRNLGELGDQPTDVKPFTEGLAIVEESHTIRYYVGRDGRRATDCRYFRAYPYYRGKACVAIHRMKPYSEIRAGFINRQGEKLGKFIYYDMYPVLTGTLYAAKKYSGYGLTDHDGNEIGDFVYDELEPNNYNESIFAVKQDWKWGYIDKNGTLIVDVVYDEAMPFAEGLAAVKKDGSWLYIDRTGKEVLKFKPAEDELHMYLRRGWGREHR